MDARAYLTGLGWRGEGHSLDHHDRGIKKPLLISHKRDLLGLGKKKAAENVSDQWWLRAFDESLKIIGTGKESTLSQVSQHGVNRGGLYGFFVKGEVLVGSISATDESSAAVSKATSVESTKSTTPPTSASEPSSDDESGSDTSEDIDAASDSEDAKSASEMSDNAELVAAPAVQPADGEQEKSKKRKRKETAEEIRKKRKEEKQEKAKADRKVNLEKEKEEAIASGTYDEAAIKEAAIITEMNRKINKIVKSNLARGVYGPLLPHPSTLRRKKGEADLNFIEDPNNPGKKLTYKSAKYAREKNMREAKRVLKKEMIVEAMQKGELANPNNLEGEEFVEWFDKEMRKKQKEGRKVQQEKKAAKLKEKEAHQAQLREEKRARREQRRIERQAKLEEKRRFEQEEAAEQAREQAPDDTAEPFQENADTIKFAEVLGKKSVSVPGYGQLDRYPSKKEKKERKLTSEAEKLGLTLDEYRAKLVADREASENKTRVEAKIKSLSDEEKTQYEERAALKKQSLEEYVLRRIQKKDEKRKEKKPAPQPQPATETEPAAQAEEPLGFIIDTEGDATLLAKVTIGVDPAKKLPKKEAPLPLDPSIWEGREVKTLSKAERRARLEWLRQRRAERKGLQGKDPRGVGDKKRSKAARKMDKQRALTAKILHDKGFEKGASAEMVQQARREAKRVMKEEKKIRKGKTNKLVLNLKGRHRVSQRAKAKNEKAKEGGKDGYISLAA